MRFRRKTLVAIAISGVLVALAVLSYVIVPRLTDRAIVAHFPAAVGLYPGDDVRILGVTVGTVDRIEPEGTRVAVHLTVDRRWKLPADAHAVVVSPTLVTARFVQLTPAYVEGPELPDGGTIPEERTAVPVEWDKIKEQLTRLSTTLGPQPGEPGTLGEFVSDAAGNLRGNGATFNDTLANLAQATTTLSDGRTDVFAAVRNLSVLVDALSQSHAQIVAFENHLASVSELVATSETPLGDALADLDAAVTDVQTFLGENRAGVSHAVDKLGAATQVLTDRRRDLEQILHVSPTVLANLENIYQPAQNSLTGAPALTNFANPTQFICSAIAAAGEQGAEEATNLCIQYLGPLLKTIAFNYAPIGAVVGNSVGALPDQIDYSEPGLPGLMLPPLPLPGGAR
ncbi:MCE family protein [Rhodococcus sp. WAY2]|uniref:MCE family protein n=1 Tax=Rhodococcus sp. WAY2 TaxID=2663121 RepID=UPI0013200237|nr:MCE family protein [Rhodococcus sp. WAY2]QHE66905.1 MCE-family protein Mce1D [Rhodococcus sp. WAY2]